MIRQPRGWSVLILLVLFKASAVFADFSPSTIYGSRERLTHEDNLLRIQSEGSLLQVQVTPNIILAMDTATDLQIEDLSQNDDLYSIDVLSGTVQLLMLDKTKIYELGAGYYRVSPQGVMQFSSPILAVPGDLGFIQSFKLGDMELTKQEVYLESLRINITVINPIIIDSIKQLFGTPVQ